MKETDPQPPVADAELVVVSNRQPYRHDRDGGDVVVDRPSGGLVAGLDPVMQRLGGTWIATGDGDADFDVADDDGRLRVPPDDPAYDLQRLHLSEAEREGYYRGYANRVLWPLCHYAVGEVDFDAEYWTQYRDVNERFAAAVVDAAGPSSTVWFQDYHFGLAPSMVRSRLPKAFLMQFWHVPWPAPDAFRACPRGRALLDGLLGNDLLGFHTPRYCRNFMRCVEALLDGATVDWTAGRVRHDGGATAVRAFPLGVDAADHRERAADADGSFWRSFREAHGIAGDTRVALGVDRLDYTKGIPERLDAVERLLETRPEWRGEVTYVQSGAESRQGIPAYRRLQGTVEAAVDRVNDRFGTDDWQPVVYTTEHYSRDELCSLYRHSDLAVVGPLRDGMNLVAQEYVASQVDDDGVLVLSELAGVHDRLGGDAVAVAPFDTDAYAESLATALEMDRPERRRRMRSLRRTVETHSLWTWLDDVFEAAREVRGAARVRQPQHER